MNYPFRTAILNFLKKKDNGEGFRDVVMSILENYPPQVVACNMNLLGTHDTQRILTALVDDFEGDRFACADRHLTAEQKEKARELLLLASCLQYTLPGAPSLYYADEAGMEGHKDPFNRRTYPWGKEDETLLRHFRNLGQLRKEEPVFKEGALRFFQAGDGKLGFTRFCKNGKIKIYVNCSDEPWEIPACNVRLAHKLRNLSPDWQNLAPMGFCIEKCE